MAAKRAHYSAVSDAGYHHPGGFVSPGQSVELTEEEAARGLETGALVETPQAPPAAKAPKAETEIQPETEEN